MKEIIPELEFCVFDLETTGFSPESGAGIIEIGAVKISEGRIHKRFQEMVRPGHEIPPKITRLTGIENQDVQDADVINHVLPRFQSFRGNSILVAHNASFDLGFLKHYSEEPIDDTHIDTVRLARRLFQFQSNSLTDLLREFDIARDDAHRALDDALATAELFLILCQEITDPMDYIRCNIPRTIREKSPHEFETNRGDIEVITSEDEARKFIYNVLIQSEREVGLNKWAKIFTGSKSKDVEKYRTHRGFGVLDDWTQKKARNVLEEMIRDGQLRKRGEHYPVLEPVLPKEQTTDQLIGSESEFPF